MIRAAYEKNVSNRITATADFSMLSNASRLTKSTHVELKTSRKTIRYAKKESAYKDAIKAEKSNLKVLLHKDSIFLGSKQHFFRFK